ncbi:MAG: hypothetical protein OXI90_07185 [Gammaproteobacteria bacterium]|nr:hypothetical protein [Gammaproteobacteria bacterium]
MKFTAFVTWIRKECGGRTHAPVEGLRPMIRFQRHIAESLETGRDIQICGLRFDQKTWTGEVELARPRGSEPLKEFIKEGELIELMDGFRVIAVGKIIEVA